MKQSEILVGHIYSGWASSKICRYVDFIDHDLADKKQDKVYYENVRVDRCAGDIAIYLGTGGSCSKKAFANWAFATWGQLGFYDRIK